MSLISHWSSRGTLSLLLSGLLLWGEAKAAGLADVRTYSTGRLPVSAVVQDLNNDGIPDIVTANETDKNLSVLLGRGGDRFAKAHNFPSGQGVVEIATGDFNHDGFADLAVTDGISAVNILLGNGKGLRLRPPYPSSPGRSACR